MVSPLHVPRMLAIYKNISSEILSYDEEDDNHDNYSNESTLHYMNYLKIVNLQAM